MYPLHCTAACLLVIGCLVSLSTEQGKFSFPDAATLRRNSAAAVTGVTPATIDDSSREVAIGAKREAVAGAQPRLFLGKLLGLDGPGYYGAPYYGSPFYGIGHPPHGPPPPYPPPVGRPYPPRPYPGPVPYPLPGEGIYPPPGSPCACTLPHHCPPHNAIYGRCGYGRVNCCEHIPHPYGPPLGPAGPHRPLPLGPPGHYEPGLIRPPFEPPGPLGPYGPYLPSVLASRGGPISFREV